MRIQPTLSLESTLISHGLPYPQNLETARELEAIARARGVEPRTIAIIGGEIKIDNTPHFAIIHLDPLESLRGH